jgi:hypothetical protein
MKREFAGIHLKGKKHFRPRRAVLWCINFNMGRWFSEKFVLCSADEDAAARARVWSFCEKGALTSPFGIHTQNTRAAE